jgi:hypothetical protein
VIRYGVYPALNGVVKRTERVFAGEDDLYINGAVTTGDIGFKRIPTKYLAVYFRASTPEAGKPQSRGSFRKRYVVCDFA